MCDSSKDPECLTCHDTQFVPPVNLNSNDPNEPCPDCNAHMLPKCTFSLAWRGPCGEPVIDGRACVKHALLKCESCGAPATHECDETFQFVCGALLCSECEHEIAENGTNGGKMKHCRKDAQKHKPWYESTPSIYSEQIDFQI